MPALARLLPPYQRCSPAVASGCAVLLAALCSTALLVGAAPAAAATAVPAWSIHSYAEPTSFSAEENAHCLTVLDREPRTTRACDHYSVVIANVGSLDSNSSEPLTVTDTLPPGVTIAGPFIQDGTHAAVTPWSCSQGSGQTVITCTTESAIPALTAAAVIELPVVVEAGPQRSAPNRVEVSGGGAPAPQSAEAQTAIGAPALPFGILGQTFAASALDPAGDLATGAAAHPAALTASFAFPSTVGNSITGGLTQSPVENVHQIVTDLPAGLVGDALAAPTCSLTAISDLEFNPAACPAASRVGTLALFKSTSVSSRLSIYNIAPEHGYPAEFGFYEPIFGRDLTLYASLVGHGAGAHVRLISSPQSLFPTIEDNGLSLIFFGDPTERDGEGDGAPFATNPADCSATGFTTTLHVDSYQHPGAVNADGTPNFADPDWKEASYESPPVGDCAALQFHPTLSLHPDNPQADSPAGLEVDLHVPQQGAEGLEGLATPPLRDATVTLPRGLAVDPSSADGLEGCSEAQIAAQSDDPGECPAASQIGTVEIQTPILAHPLPGKVYLGTPECAPCTDADAASGKLVRLYIEVDDPETGIVVKLPGSGRLDPTGGQVTASFEENPQLPFEDLKLAFKTGSRAPLTTPATCGTYTTTTDLKPWSAPQSGPDATPTSEFKVTEGAGGGACPNGEAGEPNKPAFSAGTVTPSAGAYSPFVLKLSREPGSQIIKGLDVTLPPGLTGRLAGVAECSGAQIAAAEAASGKTEQASPSCPLSSELGTVNVGAGSGTPYYVQGHAYLAGPYKGAPVSIAIITPAVAGPFDLGDVVVRAAIFVDPETARDTVRSDPIPTILAGIPLDVRSIAINITRNRFTLNPTSCEPMTLAAIVIAQSSEADVSNPFQVGGCKALGFKPKLALSLKGSTRRVGHPALKAVLTYPQGGAYANVARAQVNLPHSEFIDQANLNKTCTRPVLLAGNCPACSIYGKARAFTPLLEKPLEGPVYLVGGYGYKLPALVAELDGQIRVLLVGKVDSGPNHGIRNTFEAVPDAPVEKFVLEMKGGPKYSLLENSEDLCAAPQKAIVNLTAQNGKQLKLTPTIANSCGKGKGKGKKGGKGAKKNKAKKGNGKAGRHRAGADAVSRTGLLLARLPGSW